MNRIISALFCILLCLSNCPAEELAPESSPPPDRAERSVISSILLYLPNRLFDLVDIVRLRARVGPGVALGVRATKLLQANLGAYSTLYLGLPGPRQTPTIPLPAGLELFAGAAVSVAEVGTTTFGPNYSPTEFGLDTQLALVGFDFGLDPYEALDFLLGFVGIDPVDDDL